MCGKVYGYVCVSTKEQCEDRQLIALQAFWSKKIHLHG